MFKAIRNDAGVVDSINRISDGATVDRSNTSSPITQQFNTWRSQQNPAFDLSDWAPTAAALASMRDVKKAELKAAATRTLNAGFTSNALGASYTYTGRAIDQLNIEQAAALSTLKKLTSQLTCTNASGVKALRVHTQDQAQTVLKDLQIARETIMTKYRNLAAQVDSATTPAQINAIVWS